MKLSRVINLNAILSIALGIAFGLYAPLVLAAFQIPDDRSGDSLLYWYAVSFARLYGAIMIGFGLLLFSIRPMIEKADNNQFKRGFLFTLVIGSIIGFITCLTQQAAVWQDPLGWVLVGYYLFFGGIYVYFIVKLPKDIDQT